MQVYHDAGSTECEKKQISQSGQPMTWPKFESCTSLMQVYSIAMCKPTCSIFTSTKHGHLKFYSRQDHYCERYLRWNIKKTFQHTRFIRCVLGWQLMDKLIINSDYRGTIHCVRAELTFTHDIYARSFGIKPVLSHGDWEKEKKLQLKMDRCNFCHIFHIFSLVIHSVPRTLLSK